MEMASTQFYYYEIFVQYEEFAWVFFREGARNILSNYV